MQVIQTAQAFTARVQTNYGYCFEALQIVEDELALPAIDSALCLGVAVYESLTSERAKAGYRLCRYVGTEVAVILKMVAILVYTMGQDFRAWCNNYVEECLEPVTVDSKPLESPNLESEAKPVTVVERSELTDAELVVLAKQYKVPGASKWSYSRKLRPTEREKVLALAV